MDELDYDEAYDPYEGVDAVDEYDPYEGIDAVDDYDPYEGDECYGNYDPYDNMVDWDDGPDSSASFASLKKIEAVTADDAKGSILQRILNKVSNAAVTAEETLPADTNLSLNAAQNSDTNATGNHGLQPEPLDDGEQVAINYLQESPNDYTQVKEKTLSGDLVESVDRNHLSGKEPLLSAGTSVAPGDPSQTLPTKDKGQGMSQNERNIEANVKKIKDIICQCVKEPTVVSYLSAVLSVEESTRLKKVFMERPLEGARELIDCMVKSEAKGRWTSFQNALREAGYPNLVNHLMNKPNKSQSEEYERKMIQIFSPTLEKHLIVTDVLSELASSDVITDIDRQEVMAKLESKGNPYATIVMLDCMQCRKAPKEWYGKFLQVLCSKNYEHLVQVIEPDFLICPSQFLLENVLMDSKPPAAQHMMSKSPLCAKHIETDSPRVRNYQFCSLCREQGQIQQACVYCDDCNNCLCRQCFRDHNRFLKNHTIFVETGQGRVQIVQFQEEMVCREHEQRYTSFCDNHQELCCASCEAVSHRENCEGKVRSIPEVIKNMTDSDKQDSQLDVPGALLLASRQLEQRRSFKDEIPALRKKKKDLAKELKDQILEIVNRRFEKTISDIDKAYDELEVENENDLVFCNDVANTLHKMQLHVSSPDESIKFVANKTLLGDMQTCLKGLNDLQEKTDIEFDWDETDLRKIDFL